MQKNLMNTVLMLSLRSDVPKLQEQAPVRTEVIELVTRDMQAHPAKYHLLAKRERAASLERETFRNSRGKYRNNKAVLDTRVRAIPKIGRNDACPCGSGKKFKKCHQERLS